MARQQQLIGIQTHRTYVTGRGIEMDVSDMTESHLVNAIRYHQQQLDALEQVEGSSKDFIHTKERLTEAIDVLSAELEHRNTQETAKNKGKKE